MTLKNLTQSWGQLLIKYKELPYVVLKKNSRWFLIPHKPRPPKLIHFNIATRAIKQYSLKYNQYFSSQKLGEKYLQKYKLKLTDTDIADQMMSEQQLRLRWDDYYRKKKQYEQKYRQPFKLMNVNSYCLFKREFFANIRSQLTSKPIQKQQDQPKNKSNDNKTTKKKNTKRNKNELSSIQKINSYKVYDVWLKMSQQQKNIYQEKLELFKAEHQAKINQFVKNQQIPVVKKYHTISLFLAKYAAIYQMKVNDPKIYQIYRNLPEEQKKSLGQEAKEMNIQSKRKMQDFLKRWNISKEQLQYIKQVCIQYSKVKKQRTKQNKKSALKAKKDQKLQTIDNQQDYEQIDDQEEFQFQDKDQQKN